MMRILSICLVFFGIVAASIPVLAQEPPQDMVGILNLRERAFELDNPDHIESNSSLEQIDVEIRTSHPVDRSTSSEVRSVSLTQFQALNIYEDVPGIIVYGQYREWIMVRLDSEDVWLKKEPIDGYSDYAELIDGGRLAYLRDYEVDVADYPGGPTRKVVFTPTGDQKDLQYFEPAIHVIGRAVIEDFETYDELARTRYGHSHAKEYWLNIALPEFTCGDEAVVTEGQFATAWIRMRDEFDQYTVGFTSGGC